MYGSLDDLRHLVLNGEKVILNDAQVSSIEPVLIGEDGIARYRLYRVECKTRKCGYIGRVRKLAEVITELNEHKKTHRLCTIRGGTFPLSKLGELS